MIHLAKHCSRTNTEEKLQDYLLQAATQFQLKDGSTATSSASSSTPSILAEVDANSTLHMSLATYGRQLAALHREVETFKSELSASQEESATLRTIVKETAAEIQQLETKWTTSEEEKKAITTGSVQSTKAFLQEEKPFPRLNVPYLHAADTLHDEDACDSEEWWMKKRKRIMLILSPTHTQMLQVKITTPLPHLVYRTPFLQNNILSSGSERLVKLLPFSMTQTFMSDRWRKSSLNMKQRFDL